MINLIYKLRADKMRKEWAAGDAVRDAENVFPESVEVKKDIPYGPHGKWNLLDVNSPKNSNQKLPCIVNFHGGGWFYGTKDLYRFYAADLCTRGFIVVNFNYRLAPENPFPAAIEDCNAVITWLTENAAEYNIDLKRTFFAGDSAGGNLVYHYTTILSNPEFQKKFNFKVPEFMPKAVALNCGDYNIDEQLDDPTIKAYVRNVKKHLAQIKIKDHVTGNFPPAYVMSAPNDFLLPAFDPLIQLLESKGVPVKSKIYGTKEDPAACHVFHLNLKLAIAKECNDDECQFFKSFC